MEPPRTGPVVPELCGGKEGKRYFPELWHVQCGSGPEKAAKRTPEAASWNRKGFEGGKKRSSGRVREGLSGACQVPPGRKLLDRLDAICSQHSESTKHVFLVTPVDFQIILNTAVWKPWGDNFATPGLLPGSACALFELHDHGK